MIRLTKAIVSCLPKSWRGVAQYHINPLILDGFGVFNGQCFRQLIFIDLNRACRFEAIVETGTYVGCTTQFLARNTSVPVHTVENNAKDFQVARRHLKLYPSVHAVQANSVDFLSSLPLAQETKAFFYLDAHWEGYLPLAEEVEIVLSRFKHFVIMIDDFGVPGDEGYTYDDYGPGKRLSLRDFPFHKDPRVKVFTPSRHSSQESGARRGCIVLASLSLAASVDSLDSLKHLALSDVNDQVSDFAEAAVV
jgi:predicted O-methyltransferase YrrM